MQCLKCNSENKPDAKFCRGCGNKLEKLEPVATCSLIECSLCGHANQAGMKFCPKCGAPIIAAAPASTVPVSRDPSNTLRPANTPAPAKRPDAATIRSLPASEGINKAVVGGVIAAVLIATIGGGYWFYQKQESGKVIAAEKKREEEARISARTSIGTTAVTANSQRATTSVVPSRQGQVEQLESPQLRVGDTYVFESRNITEPGLTYTAERKVIGVDRDTVNTTMRILKNGYTWHVNYDRQWNVISSRSQAGDGSDHSPPVRYFDFPLYTGKTWSASSEERNVKTGKTRIHKMRGVIGGWEEITVPAGQFRGLRVTLHTEFEDESGLVSAEDVSWYVPEIKRSVLSRITSLNHRTQERREQEIALLSYQFGVH